MTDSQRDGTARKRPMKLSISVSLMVGSVIVSMLLVVYTLYFVHISNLTRDGVKAAAFAVARTLADDPVVKHGLLLPPDRNLIQPVAGRVQQRNGLMFVVVTDMHGIRYSHPNPATIGARFFGNDINPTLAGHENAAINRGTLGDAMRVFTPVYNDKQRQIGVVSVGISLSKVTDQISRSRWNVLWTLLFSAPIGALGIGILVRMLKQVLFGLEPYEISSLFIQRQAMLQSLKEGVIAVDSQGRVTLINHAARKMLLSADELQQGKRVEPGPLVATLGEVVRSGKPVQDREIRSYGRLFLCNILPVRNNNQVIGAISTFRDKTEMQLLMQRLDGMVSYVDALRERSHEFMNKLHVILGLLHMKNYRQLEDYILQTANNYQEEIGALQHKIRSPVVAGFLLGKMDRARGTDHVLTLAEECLVPDNPNEQQVTGLITVLGNLIENALEALSEQSGGEVSVLLHYQNGWLGCEVSDDGPGIAPEHIQAIFQKGFSTKGGEHGVGLTLAQQQVEQLGGSITVESEPGVFTQFFVQLPWDSERKDS
ncbi:two-component system sensor histidine kinase DcuS [Erwinia psidii]|uniref:sensor histidine kinase n=1 Tax=Erwinia psidii TaxID=69224 RepID=UPI00226B1BBB|nr:sensor histidine kinase [Erwinia psidii]MCX8959275.1 two-component system sensor histidine kinase DcuS [Erwinia psidii]MCX8962905.1 two-component system sensor histidine kinase DcuS [Erwinia psidii]